MKNQIFLGVLGSLVVPRREIQNLLPILSDAGVRFVYFSPRNMRRQKELASQMGIDVAWNCAISLRPLESGEEDPHRMVSTERRTRIGWESYMSIFTVDVCTFIFQSFVTRLPHLEHLILSVYLLWSM